jgi:GDP-D-mannose dehydratase
MFTARDYVEGMWLMLQQDEPDDYVLATGAFFFFPSVSMGTFFNKYDFICIKARRIRFESLWKRRSRSSGFLSSE